MWKVKSQPDHKQWSHVLTTYVTPEGLVNYSQLKKNSSELNKYLNQLKQYQPDESWSKQETMAYWINAYNAYTIKLILEYYPVRSIKDIKKPWNQKFIPYDNGLISLHEIEHDILRRMGDPRIHFAIVCASKSCPNLKNEAFEADLLESQLNESTLTFLMDPEKNSYSDSAIDISKIFKWFSKDFKADGGVISFINSHLNSAIKDSTPISYKPYSWSLNE
jgi:hypothetical protein